MQAPTSGGAMTLLTDEPDDVLDASLTRLYMQHEAAMAVGDTQARAEVHWGIVQVLAEQSRRLDVWIAERLKERA